MNVNLNLRQYRVRPENHDGKSQLCHPQEHQENADDFSI